MFSFAQYHSLKNVFKYVLFSLLYLTLLRIGFGIWQWDRVNSAVDLPTFFLNGLRFDIVILSLFLLFPLALTPLMAIFKLSNRLWQPILRFYLVASFTFLAFMEFATPNFINQYDVRPNNLFIEYLIYPKEVLSMLWVGYKIELILMVIFVPSVFFLIHKALKPVDTQRTMPWPTAILTAVVLFLLLVMGGRSTLGHRAVNPSTVAVTTDLLVNDLMLNSSYSVLYALSELMSEEKGGVHYGNMPIEQAQQIVRKSMGVADAAFTQGSESTLHKQQALNSKQQPFNLVIILEESLGAEFVGSLGGLPLTPNIDALGKEGIWFENLYATGTRSVRGIEAITTGFTPTAERSVVKRPKSQSQFFTIAKYLSEKGYDTSFIYGGESHFDNMRRFFVGNGFTRIVDESDYENPIFKGSWGVSDEDLLNKAHEVFLKQGDKPFFSLVFTSSNHSPFEYPKGKIELYDEDPQTVNNAVKYADFALGEFIKKAKKAPYWSNTLFLVVADHNSRVYGASLVPIERFHVPAFILGADIKAEKIETLASQIDLPVTLLSLMGVSGEHPMIGHDLLSPQWRKRDGRAIMQYHNTQAYWKSNSVVLLQPDKVPTQYDYINGQLQRSLIQDQERLDEALAHSIWTSWSYEHQKYK